MPILVTNPATGQRIARYPTMPAAELRRVVRVADRAFHQWRREPLAERAGRFRAVARILRLRAGELADLMADEMGKPVREGRAEIEKCAWVSEYYAEHAGAFLAPELVETDARKSLVTCQPLGVVLAVMPWNFPFWQVFRFAVPTLMAGNAGLLKHAANVPGCALAIEEILHAAGVPRDLFRTLLIETRQVHTLIRNSMVRAVSLTGSTEAGRAVARTAGAALKKTLLELGGSDPYLILEDADLEAAASACATSRLINTGQSCIAAKRFLVLPSVRERFECLLVERMGAARMGDPRREETTLGPLARVDLRDALHEQVLGSVARGARCLLGGAPPDRPGAWYPATVLTDVGPGMPAFEQELFGPVAAIIPVADEAEALEVANGSRFGLGAAVFTRDLARGERLATAELEAGSCFVNGFVKSDPRLPFGGIKESGWGRELSAHGIREFVNLKTVWVA